MRKAPPFTRHSLAKDITCPSCGSAQRGAEQMFHENTSNGYYYDGLFAIQRCSAGCGAHWRIVDFWTEHRVVIERVVINDGQRRRDDQGDPGDEHDACTAHRPASGEAMQAMHGVLHVPRSEGDPEG